MQNGELKPEYHIGLQMGSLLQQMRVYKPEERSEHSRLCAIAITDMEKVMAFWHFFIANGEDHGSEEGTGSSAGE